MLGFCDEVDIMLSKFNLQDHASNYFSGLQSRFAHHDILHALEFHCSKCVIKISITTRSMQKVASIEEDFNLINMTRVTGEWSSGLSIVRKSNSPSGDETKVGLETVSTTSCESMENGTRMEGKHCEYTFVKLLKGQQIVINLVYKRRICLWLICNLVISFEVGV